jgi:DNA polymerase I
VVENEKLVALDIETTNGQGSGALDPRVAGSDIALVQIAFETPSGIDISIHKWSPDTRNLVQKLIDDDYRVIIHNASFELDWFLIKAGIRFKKIWCTMVASQILNAGKDEIDEATAISGRLESKNLDYLGKWTPLLEENDDNIRTQKAKNYFSHTLQATVYRYANGAKIEKDQGNSDWGADELTERQIRYAQDDVRYLVEVARNQWSFLKRFKMERVAALEMRVAISINEMKFRGIKIAQDKWQESAAEHAEIARQLEQELNPALGLELAERDNQRSVFGTFIPKSFKVSSPSQLAKFFGTENADESVLKSLDHPLIPNILKFKEHDKIASTYGASYLKHIRDDGRIHAGLVQADVATGRLSSRKPALQVIPPDMLKSLLTTDDDKLLVFADYSSVESRILAYISGDESFIHSVNSTDVHFENAKKIFGLPPTASRSDMFTFGDSQVSGDELRRKAKGTSFGIVYGISAVGLVNRGFASNADEGQDLIDNFFRQYPKVNRHLKSAIAEGLTRGYTQDPLGRVRWYEVPKRLSDDELRQLTGRISRQSQNFAIQSSSANITKQAIVDLYDYFASTGHGYMILTIHDSIICEVYREHQDAAVNAIKTLMEEAGPQVIPGIITPVDVELGHKEKRACRVTGLKFSVYSELFKGGKVVPNDAWVEPRVAKLLAGTNTSDYNGSLVRLSDVLRIKPVEWQKENQDIINAVNQILERHR